MFHHIDIVIRRIVEENLHNLHFKKYFDSWHSWCIHTSFALGMWERYIRYDRKVIMHFVCIKHFSGIYSLSCICRYTYTYVCNTHNYTPYACIMVISVFFIILFAYKLLIIHNNMLLESFEMFYIQVNAYYSFWEGQ